MKIDSKKSQQKKCPDNYETVLTNQVYSEQIVNNHDIGIVGKPYRKVDKVI